MVWEISQILIIDFLKELFSLEAYHFTILWWFCHTSTWIRHGCTYVPPCWTPSHLPPHPIPLGCPRALALGALLHTSNLRWPSILHMVTYTFQCYSLKSSHSCLLAHSPEVCSLHLCLFCCFAYRVVVTVFLYFTTHTRTHTHTHIHALIYCIGVSLSDVLPFVFV